MSEMDEAWHRLKKAVEAEDLSQYATGTGRGMYAIDAAEMGFDAAIAAVRELLSKEGF